MELIIGFVGKAAQLGGRVVQVGFMMTYAALAAIFKHIEERRQQLEVAALPASPNSQVADDALEDDVLEVDAIAIPEPNPSTICEATAIAVQPPDVTEDEPSVPAPQAPQAATMSRAALVQSLLDEAYGQGLKTYDQLMGYVAEHSGKSCSKSTIVSWKKSRNLLKTA
jgi:hypothetical protein